MLFISWTVLVHGQLLAGPGAGRLMIPAMQNSPMPPETFNEKPPPPVQDQPDFGDNDPKPKEPPADTKSAGTGQDAKPDSKTDSTVQRQDNQLDPVKLLQDFAGIAGKYAADAYKRVSPEVDRMLAALPAAPEKKPQWTAEKSDKKDQTTIKYNAVENVSMKDFQDANPGVKLDLGKLNEKDRFNVKHATTLEKDGGWKIESLNADGSLRMTKEYAMNVEKRKDHGGLVESTPGTSEEHTKKIEDKLNELPQNVRDNLAKAGYKVIATGYIPDAMPSLAKLTPRGWPADMTFFNSDGTHDNVSKRIIAPSRVMEGKDASPVTRDEVVVHQVGHALDFANGMLSASKEFREAYDKEIKAALKRYPEDETFKYLSQPNGVGAQETFATLFGQALTGPENASQKELFDRVFPKTLDAVRAQIKALR